MLVPDMVRRIPTWSSVLISFGACLVLAGWAFGAETLKRIVPGMISMNPTTAVCFFWTGIALALCSERANPRRQRQFMIWGRIIAGFVLIIAALRLAHLYFHLHFQIDQYLFASKLGDNGMDQGVPLPRSSMAPNTAISFIFSSLAMLLLDKELGPRKLRPTHLFLVLLLWVSWLGLLGYVYNTKIFYLVSTLKPVALHTALGFLVATVGMAFLRPRTWLTYTFIGPGAGGILARRLLPSAFIVPTLLGGLRLLGQRAGYFGTDFGGAATVMANILIFCAIIWWSAASLNRIERERDQASRVVADSEKRFRSVWENSADGMRLADQEGIIIEVNAAYCQMAGLSPAEMISKPITVAYHPDSNHAALMEFFREQSRSPVPTTNLLRGLKLHSGRVVDLECTNSAIATEEGRRLVLTIFHDVTHRLHAEEEIRGLNEELERHVASRTVQLKESEERYRFLSETLPEIVWTAKAGGEIDYHNKRWHEYTGMPAGQASNWGWKKCIHPDDLEILLAGWIHAVRTGSRFEVESRLRRGSDGAYRWHLTRAFPFKNDKDEVVQWIGTCTDIDDLKRAQDEIRKLNSNLERRVNERTTALERANKSLEEDIAERKRIEAALRESEERFRKLAAASPIGIFQTDAEGQCLYANEQWQKIAGLELGDCLGEGWARAVHPDDRELVFREWSECARASRDFSLEFRLMPPRGGERWVHSHAAPILAGSVINGFVGTTEDITNRKTAESKLKDFAAQLEKSNRELKDALASVKTLRGLLPICAGCKKIRDDKGYWNQIEFFIRDHSDANFSHSMCPECASTYFPGVVVNDEAAALPGPRKRGPR